jgi:methylmalonyl-CoA/ethylmalonyl-CoA epimerase
MTIVPIQKVDHVALAVWSMVDACRLFVDVLGAQFIGGGDNPELGVRAVQLRVEPGTKIELLSPLDEQSYLHRYLDRHGEGFHHMTVYVDDVAEAANALVDAGFGVVDTSLESEVWRETFVRPSAAFGALIQVAWARDRWDQPFPGLTLEAVLDGQVQVVKNVVTWKSTGRVLSQPDL